MAHQLTPDEVDQLAADHAATIEPVQEEHLSGPLAKEATLAYGAEGEPVTKLVNVLSVLGYDTNKVIHGGPARLDETVLADVRAAQEAIGLSEPPVLTIQDAGGNIAELIGELVGPTTLTALYEAAAAKLEGEQAGGGAAPA